MTGCNKYSLRRTYLAVRESMNLQIRAEKSRSITEQCRFLHEFRSAVNFLLYAPIRCEADITPLIAECKEKQKVAFFPRVDREKGGLNIYRVRSINELKPGIYGIPEPSDFDAVQGKPADMDLFFVPGIAFDVAGYRIGFGKGYYDKMLAGLKVPSVGIAFEEQIIDAVPSELHDIPVDIVVTDQRIICCHGH